MNRKTTVLFGIVFAAMAVVFVVFCFSCDRQPAPQAATQTASQPDATSPPPPPPPPPVNLPKGEDSINLTSSLRGNALEAVIESNSPCTSDSDCSSTKLANVPRSSSECTCAAACTPNVVNVREAAARKAAYKQHCQLIDVLGPKCPVPECRFLEFEAYKCIKGKCTGLALGMK